MKVIIIGSGIAGLTLALALERANIQVSVYEKTQTLQNIGGGIILWPHGVRYLQWLDLFSCIEPYSVDITRCNIIDNAGQTIFSEDCSAFLSLLGGSILPIPRSTLQQSLLKKISPTCLSLGKTCVSVTENSKEARVEFSDGSFDTADLVVGADGIHSVVRQQILGENTPIYTNLCWWGGIVDKAAIPDFITDQSYVVLGERKTFIAWPTYDERWMWYALVKMPLPELIQSGNGLKQLRAICKDWHPGIEKLLSAPMTSHFHLGAHTLQAPITWSSKRVTLVGDAAHATGPILAQGTSLAIEDAFALANLLQRTETNIETTLKQYESLRRDIYEKIYHLENQSADMMVADNLETLEQLQQKMSELSLAAMYKEIIPLVNLEASLKLAHTVQSEIALV